MRRASPLRRRLPWLAASLPLLVACGDDAAAPAAPQPAAGASAGTAGRGGQSTAGRGGAAGSASGGAAGQVGKGGGGGATPTGGSAGNGGGAGTGGGNAGKGGASGKGGTAGLGGAGGDVSKGGSSGASANGGVGGAAAGAAGAAGADAGGSGGSASGGSGGDAGSTNGGASSGGNAGSGGALAASCDPDPAPAPTCATACALHERCGTGGVCAPSAPSFVAPKTIALPAHSNRLVAGDFDADGRTDLLSYDIQPGTTVLRQTEPGVFTSTLLDKSGRDPVVGRFDAGTTLDVLVRQGGTVVLWRGKGDGTFTQGGTASTSSFSDVLYADADGDGATDVVQNGVSFGDGNGQFGAKQTIDLGYRPLGFADLNGDGKRDAIGISFNDDIEVRLGLGSRSFGAPIVTTWQHDAEFAFVLADMNADGLPDVVSQRRVLLAQPSGSYLVGEPGWLFPLSYGLYPARLAGDAVDDVLGNEANAINALFGKPGALFSPPTAVGAYGIDIASAEPAVIDVTGDGVADLLVPNEFGATASLLVGTGDTTKPFTADAEVVWALGGERQGAAQIGDLDRDGRLDVVRCFDVGASTGMQCSVFAGTPAGLAAPKPLVLSFGDPITPPVLGDWDGDGALDLVTQAGGELLVARGDCHGAFAPPEPVSDPPLPAPLFAADFDGDGIVDFLAESAGAYVVRYGTGTPGHLPELAYDAPLRVGDFDGDGDLDIFEEDTADDTIQVWLHGTKGQPFTKGPALPFGLTVTWDFGVGDLDGDKKADFVVTNGSKTSFLLSKQSYTPRIEDEGDATSAVLLRDLDGDGRLDLVYTRPTTLTAWGLYQLGKGDGTFEPAVRFASSSDVLAVGDFTGDGRADVLSGSYGGVLRLLRSKE